MIAMMMMTVMMMMTMVMMMVTMMMMMVIMVERTVWAGLLPCVVQLVKGRGVFPGAASGKGHGSERHDVREQEAMMFSSLLLLCMCVCCYTDDDVGGVQSLKENLNSHAAGHAFEDEGLKGTTKCLENQRLLLSQPLTKAQRSSEQSSCASAMCCRTAPVHEAAIELIERQRAVHAPEALDLPARQREQAAMVAPIFRHGYLERQHLHQALGGNVIGMNSLDPVAWPVAESAPLLGIAHDLVHEGVVAAARHTAITEPNCCG